MGRALRRVAAVAGIPLGVWLLVVALGFTPALRAIELRLFDWWTVLAAPAAGDGRIVVVTIDEDSFLDLGLQWPWPRDIHARLVERLAEAGAAVIVLDVVFAEPSTPAADGRLAQAIRRAGNVVLAAEDAAIENAYVSQRIRVEPIPELASAAAAVGLATFSVDPDSILRRFPAAPDALWRAAVDVAARRGVVSSPIRVPGAGELIRFTGGEQPFDTVAYYQALEPAKMKAPGFFRDRIVLVGLDLKATPDLTTRQADTFATPLIARSGRFTAGVQVQAHVLDSVLRDRSIRPVPAGAVAAVFALVLVVATWLMRPWRPVAASVVAVGLAAVVLGLAWSLFLWMHLWLPAAGMAAGVLVLYTGEGAAAYVREQALRQRIKQAFGRYVSPHIVEQIVADPGRLKLGGERRAVSVLFCDLAGFTTISERMSPEAVVELLTRYLTAVTRVVIDSGGTVVKYLGDGMMALWGAPLDDPDHARHACESAIAMQAALAALNAELATPLSMRVGVHSGDAVVGNMGSDTRFDYTATGDTVNLASRLEGVNKLYGTGILVSDATVRLAGDAVRFRRVDLVRVKGKHDATEIFTPAPDEALVQRTDAAIDAYRKRSWDEAERLWRETLAARPDDRVAAVHLERIARFRDSPPPDDWDGSITLTEK
jgi:adenylate cyclase